MDAAALAIETEIDNQLLLITQSTDAVVQGRALAVLTVLLSRCSEDQVAQVAAVVPDIQNLLKSNNRIVQANACAALTAASAISDDLARTIAAESTSQLVSLLQECSSRHDQPDLQLNVVSALCQLARDQQPTAEALLDPETLPCLLLLAGRDRPAKLQEAVADSFCALAASKEARGDLIAAGVVPLVANLLTVEHLEISVRSLMVLGMLCCGSQTAQQQLAEEAGALQELLALLKQQEDMDCKVLARDMLGLLMKDDELKGSVEAALRAAGGGVQQQKQQQLDEDEQPPHEAQA